MKIKKYNIKKLAKKGWKDKNKIFAFYAILLLESIFPVIPIMSAFIIAFTIFIFLFYIFKERNKKIKKKDKISLKNMQST